MATHTHTYTQLLAVNTSVPVRHLNMHEYQSKRLMEQYNINTQKFFLAESPSEAGNAAKKLGKD